MSKHSPDFLSKDTDLERRRALVAIASMLGLTVSEESVAMTDHALTTQGGFLDEQELNITAALAEAIIPATDTPGAIGVGAHNYISQHLKFCVTAWRQDQFRKGLQRVEQQAITRFKSGFVWLTQEQQAQLLQAIEAKQGFTDEDKNFFVFLKSLTLLAYYTSEIGATQELAFLPMPGGYKGSFPFAAVGRAWAS